MRTGGRRKATEPLRRERSRGGRAGGHTWMSPQSTCGLTSAGLGNLTGVWKPHIGKYVWKEPVRGRREPCSAAWKCGCATGLLENRRVRSRKGRALQRPCDHAAANLNGPLRNRVGRIDGLLEDGQPALSAPCT